MKFRIFTFLFILTVIITDASYSQCVTPLVPVKYTQTISNSGNVFHTFTMPKADPAYGTLVEVRITTVVSIGSVYTFENVSVGSELYRARLLFDVTIISPELTDMISNGTDWFLGQRFLQGDNGIPNSGPDYYQSPIQTNTDSIVKESITGNVAPFLGTGTVSFDFYSSAYGAISPPSGGSVNTNATVTFAVEYIFCDSWFLAAGMNNFSAIKTGGKNVQLNWSAQNEESVRQYEIQVSEDGINYYTVNKVDVNDASDNSSHRYNHSFSSPKDQLFFRVKQIELNGAIHYSATKLITWKKEAKATLQVYPNPAVNYFTIDFPKGVKANWRVDIISANGQLVQSHRLANTDFGRIDLNRSLNRGFYLIRATNEQTHEQVTQRLILVTKDL